MIGTPVKTDDDFFLNNIVDPSWNLIKNEYRVVRVILYSVIMVLLAIDLLAIVFFFKMSQRIDTVENDPFTILIKRSQDSNSKMEENHMNHVK